MTRAIVPKVIYRFSVNMIKIVMTFFTQLEKTIQEFIWNHKRSWTAKANLRRNITLPDLKFYDRAILTKIAWH